MASDERAASLGLGVWHGEGYYKGINLDELRSLLAAQGLHVVTDAEMAVLDDLCEPGSSDWIQYDGITAAQAELLNAAIRARRERVL